MTVEMYYINIITFLYYINYKWFICVIRQPDPAINWTNESPITFTV